MARATRGHRFGGVPTTPRGRDLLLLGLFFGYEPFLWMGICRGLEGRVISLKIFEPSGENPYCVAVNNVDPRVSLFT